MRYFTSSGSNPEQVKACFHMCGPQDESQISESIRKILDMPGVTQIDIRFNHGQGDRIKVIRKMPTS